MKLKGVYFNNIFCAPGTFGYFGEKKAIFFNIFLRNITFVSSVTTFFSHEQPEFKTKKTFKNWFQNSNKLSKLGAGVVLSKEDISGPGLEKLLERRLWQKMTKPFFLSVISLENSREKRILEMRKIVQAIKNAKHEFKSKFGIIICFLDPDDNDYDLFIEEVNETLEIFSSLEIPIIAQFTLSLPPDVIEKIASNKNCDAISVNTSITWERFPKDAKKIFFRINNSPISSQNGGYVFGKYIEPLSAEWTRQAKKYSAGKPLIMGGGILGSKNIDGLARVGANGFILDKAVFLRFWNVPKIINRAKMIFSVMQKTKDMQKS